MSRKYKFHNQEGVYFITFATVKWVDVFIRKIYQDILMDSIGFCQKQKGLEIFAWCIMPSHIHMIIKSKDHHSLPDIIRDLKKFTSIKLIQAISDNPGESRKEWLMNIFLKEGKKNCNNVNYQFWQQDNHPIELWTEIVFDQKMDYIHNNPVQAGFVENPEDYLLSSARDYFGTGKGLIDLEELY